MRRIHYIESGDYSVRFAAYCGMSFGIGEDRQTKDEAIETVKRTIAAREKTGHSIAVLVPDRQWEISEPEDSAMVPDTAGILTITPFLLRAVACWKCDAIVPIGETCSDCENRNNEDNEDNEDNETETETK